MATTSQPLAPASAIPFRSPSTSSRPVGPTEIILDFSAPGQQAKPPLKRRRHVNSRLGCSTCKNRRVKCNEARPVCAQCSRLGLECTYIYLGNNSAQKQQQKLQRQHGNNQMLADQLTIRKAVGSSMSLENMELYHHFIHAAFPSTPMDGKEGYLKCTAMSLQLDYLSHALLALAATHLTVHTNANYKQKALQHRGSALRLIKQRLSLPVNSIAEADSLLAAICCLNAETSLNVDCMSDYLSTGRGAYVISTALVIPLNSIHADQSIFCTSTMVTQMARTTALIEDQAKDFELIADFERSVASLRSICKHELETQYQQGLWRAVRALPTSSLTAVTWFGYIYELAFKSSNDDFNVFRSEDNLAGQLLLAHTFMLDYLLGQTCMSIDTAPKFGGRKPAVMAWVKRMANSLPPKDRAFGEFPLRFCGIMETYDARWLFFP